MKQVIIIDDNTDILDILEEYLKNISEFDIRVVKFEDASKVIPYLENEHCDLVITDILMPNKNGIELIENLLQKYSNLKILACSGGGDSGKMVAGLALDQAIEEGASSAIMKPFTEKEFARKVKKLLAA